MKEIYHYKTIKGSSKGYYKEKGSKFIALAYQIESEEQFNEVYLAVKRNIMTHGTIVLHIVYIPRMSQ